MKGVQCYELLGGIALKIHTFSFSFPLDGLSAGSNVNNLHVFDLCLSTCILCDVNVGFVANMTDTTIV